MFLSGKKNIKIPFAQCSEDINTPMVRVKVCQVLITEQKG